MNLTRCKKKESTTPGGWSSTPTIKKQSWNSTIPILYDDVKVVDFDFGFSEAEYAIHFVCQ